MQEKNIRMSQGGKVESCVVGARELGRVGAL